MLRRLTATVAVTIATLVTAAIPAAALLRVVGRFLGAIALVTVIVSALRGTDLPAYALFIGFWVVLPLVLAVVGDVYPLVNPYAGVADLVERAGIGRSPAWLERAGVWPAAVVLLAFGWFELAHPDPAEPTSVLGFVLAYSVVMVLGSLWWGRAWIRPRRRVRDLPRPGGAARCAPA